MSAVPADRVSDASDAPRDSSSPPFAERTAPSAPPAPDASRTSAPPPNSGNDALGSVPRPITMSVKPRSRSSVTPRPNIPARQKMRQASFNLEAPPSLKPLNTHSPIAMAAAAAVTSDKIRKLLVSQGPLPIRHITSHLAATITGFGELSLSKQRRLIIAVLDGPKSEFVKVGWGRWAVEGSDAAHAEGAPAGSPAPAATPAANSSTSKRSSSMQGHSRLSLSAHRESISRQLPNAKPPLSPSLGPIEDSAVFSDSESSDNDYDDSEVEGTDEEDWQAIGPTQLRQTSPREQDAIAALVQLRSN